MKRKMILSVLLLVSFLLSLPLFLSACSNDNATFSDNNTNSLTYPNTSESDEEASNIGVDEETLTENRLPQNKTIVQSYGCYKMGIEHNGLYYFIMPDRYSNDVKMLCSLDPQTDTLQKLIEIELYAFVRFVGISSDNEIYLTDGYSGSLKYNIKTGELSKLLATTFSGATKSIVISGFSDDYIYFWCPNDLDSILYRCNINLPLSESETIFTAPKSGWEQQFKVVDHFAYYIVDIDAGGCRVCQIDLNDYPLKSDFILDLDASCSIVNISNTYILFFTQGPTFGPSEDKLFLYNRATEELLKMEGVPYVIQYSDTFDAEAGRLYFWYDKLYYIDFSNLKDGQAYSFKNGYFNDEIRINAITRLGDHFYLGDWGVQYRISLNGTNFEDLR